VGRTPVGIGWQPTLKAGPLRFRRVKRRLRDLCRCARSRPWIGSVSQDGMPVFRETRSIAAVVAPSTGWNRLPAGAVPTADGVTQRPERPKLRMAHGCMGDLLQSKPFGASVAVVSGSVQHKCGEESLDRAMGLRICNYTVTNLPAEARRACI
jgi:hypothetical protein